MKDFRVEEIAQAEFEEAAIWYETQRADLGLEFITEIDRELVRIAHADKFVTAPIATLETLRRVIMIRRGSSSPARWRSRL